MLELKQERQERKLKPFRELILSIQNPKSRIGMGSVSPCYREVIVQAG